MGRTGPEGQEVETSEAVEDVVDPDEHLFDLYAEDAPENGVGLGYVAEGDTIEVEVAGEAYTVHQSESSFQNSRQFPGGTTGFVLWSTTPQFAKWLVERRDLSQLEVLELGCGVAGLLARVVGPHCKKYVATDQRPALKLLRENIAEDCIAGGEDVETAEYDWEQTDEQVILDLFDTDSGFPDLIIACDTVYNPYLAKPFVAALKACSDQHTEIYVGLQLRESSVLEGFLEECLRGGFHVQYIANALAVGYAVYHLIR